jgi:hypothetical protein
MTTFRKLTLAALAIAGTCSGALSQDVGTIQADKLAAWVNKMPPGPFSIYVIGTITAPTPCHQAITSYQGDSKSEPPIYRVKVTIVEQPGVICIQKISDIDFRYDQPNYVGNHQEMEIFSDADSKTVKIDVVQ